MRGTKERICALDNRLRIISAIPAGGDLSGSKADFAIMHERLAYAGKEKVIQAWIVIEKSTIKGFLCKACYFAKADTIITYKLLRGWKRQVDASSGGIPIATIAFDNAKSRPNASNDGEGYLSLYKASSDALAVLYVDSSGSQRPIPRSFFSTFAADTATATATANALVATVPLLLLLSLSNALFYPIFSAAFFVLWFSVLFFPPSSSYGLQRRQEQGQDQDQDQDQERDRQRNTGTSQEQQSQQPSRQPLQQEQQQHTNIPTAVPYLRPPQSLPSSSYSSFSSSSLPGLSSSSSLPGLSPPPSLQSLSSSFSSSSSYGPTPPLRPFQGRGIQQFLDQFEEQVLDRRVDWLPFFVAPPCLWQIQVLTEDLPWPAAKTALLRYYGAFDQIRTVGFYEKLRRHEAWRPKTKDTIDWLEKHAFLCRKIGSGYGPGPGPGPDESTEHSYGLFQALPKEIQGVVFPPPNYLHAWGCTAYVTKLKEKIVRSEKMAPRAWKGYLVGIEVVRARDIRFVNRARLSAIVDNPSIEFKACLEEEERDQSKGRLRTPEGDPSHLPLPDPTPNKGETARRPITKKLTFCRRHLRAFLASFNPLVCVDRITAPKALLIRRDLGHGAYKTLEEIRPSQFSCIESCEEIINEKAAILDALYEVKHLAHEDAVALEIYDSLRLERSRDRDRTRPDITYSVKKLLEANCHLIHAYLVALKHLLRYLRGTYSLRITLGGYPRLYGRIRNLPSGRPYCVEIKALDDSYD
ncbi:hypothetical protein L249_4862 [Ophiocordyceps polyrhachis-furcata BCC 54312]|uniref:Uncharacterized protein n=1 Tax=Ophiocordyceps polyrhachis-furcata BCC 54312 TaxID=1330021 RepID=A0A367L2G7_9HYPO|nr:hypothetical protein L249_4862 [Ophiocordyceps polyrhachis-furcata BCC 54312]